MTHDLDKVGTIFSSRWENVVIATSPNLTVSPTFKGGQINNVPGIHVLYLQCTAVASKPRKRPIPLVRGKSPACCRISVQESSVCLMGKLLWIDDESNTCFCCQSHIGLAHSHDTTPATTN